MEVNIEVPWILLSPVGMPNIMEGTVSKLSISSLSNFEASVFVASASQSASRPCNKVDQPPACDSSSWWHP